MEIAEIGLLYLVLASLRRHLIDLLLSVSFLSTMANGVFSFDDLNIFEVPYKLSSSNKDF